MHPGVEPWSKAGLIIKVGTRQGSAYAAVLVTGGHGVRMQYDYTQDIAGPPGRPTPADPRWLRLTRSGDTVTGYASTDGTRWTPVGSATLPGLPAAVVTGLVLAAGTVAVLGSLLAGRLILPGHGFTAAHGFAPLSLAQAAVLRATAGSVLYLALVALLSLGAADAVARARRARRLGRRGAASRRPPAAVTRRMSVIMRAAGIQPGWPPGHALARRGRVAF